MGKRKLGRGLQALLGGDDDEIPAMFPRLAARTLPAPEAGGETATLPVNALVPNPFQPRRDYAPAELAALADSVRQHGVIQPILVRPHEGRHQIVAGERRFRAARAAGLAEIPVRVLELDDQQVFAYALVENLQRQDLNAIEKAQAFQDYIGRFAVTHEELARRLGMERATVTNFIRLLELPAPVQQMVRGGTLPFGHARALLTLRDPEAMLALAHRTVAEGLTSRQVEALVKEPQPLAATPPARPVRGAAAKKTGTILAFERGLRERLGAKVEIRPKAKDKGAILIHFASHDEFERLMGLLGAA